MIDRDALLDLLDNRRETTAGELADEILALDAAPKARSLVSEIGPRDQARLAVVLAEQVRPDGECLLWTGKTGGQGYGVVVLNQGLARTTSAHRAAWILAHGPLSDPQLVIDHLCRNRGCVRVEHLELVTVSQNVQRGWDARKRTHCQAGHALSGANLREYRNPRTGYTSRICRECRRTYRLQH